RTATLTVRAPEKALTKLEDIRAAGASWWALECFRELDLALLHLRFNAPTIGLVLVRTEGDAAAVIDTDGALAEHEGDWFVSEVRHQIRRVLKRMDLTAKSFFAIVEPGSCFAGTLFELLL